MVFKGGHGSLLAGVWLRPSAPRPDGQLHSHFKFRLGIYFLGHIPCHGDRIGESYAISLSLNFMLRYMRW